MRVIQKERYIRYGGIIIGLLLLLYKAKDSYQEIKKLKVTTASSTRVSPVGMQAAYVKKDELVTAKTFQVISNSRAGYLYTGAKLDKNNLISFKSSKAGYFTRYVLLKNNTYYAEIKPA